MRIVVILVALVVMYSPTRLRAQFPPFLDQQNVENAAVKYLRADASLRQSYVLAPDAPTKLLKALDSPLDAEDEKLVAAAEDALVEFRHGAAIQRCDWSMSIKDGPLANTAHRGAIMELVAVSGLRARIRFRDSDSTGAVGDVLAAIAAARHLSMDGSLASVLIAYRLENAIVSILSQNLNGFSSAQLNELSSSLDSLPKGSSLGIAFESEKLSRNDLLAAAQGAMDRDDLVGRLVSRIPVLQSKTALAREIVDGCGSSVVGFVNCVNQQQSFYASWAPRFTLPPEQFEMAYKAEIQEISRTNPVVREFTPSLPRLRWAEAYSQTRRALLRAAIAVQIEGSSALNRHFDPYDGNPFSYVPLNGGFSLQSRLSDGGIPISLSILARTGDRKASQK